MSSRERKFFRFIEFFMVGLFLGIIEDLIAIKIITNEPMSFRMIWVAALVAFPFAIFSELIVDHPDFWRKFIKHDKN